jgi:hypothetical protein
MDVAILVNFGQFNGRGIAPVDYGLVKQMLLFIVNI